MTSQNAVVVVTGGNRGIGLELCRQLAERGYLVVLGGRDADKAAEILNDHRVAPRQLDVADLGRVATAMETNLFGAWRTTMALLPLLLRRGGHGRVVNVSSREASLADMGAGTPGYHVSKAALNAMTRTLAAELRDDGVLVNAVSPGWTATDMGGPGGRPIAEGAASILWGVTLPDDGPTGGFFQDGAHLPW